MSMNLCDITDRAMVFHPNEIKAMFIAAANSGNTELKLPNGEILTLEDWHEMMVARWNRAVSTSSIIDAYRDGRVNLVDSATASSRVH